MIDQINELSEDGLKSSPETSRYVETHGSVKTIKISCTFLQLTDILNDLILICRITTSSCLHRLLLQIVITTKIAF